MSNVLNWPVSTGSDRMLSMDRKIINVAPKDWRSQVTDKLNELTGLERGWDGYNAPPVKFDTAHFALQILEAVCPEEAPPPQFVPGASGDLQIEWHTDNGTIELHVMRPYFVNCWYSESQTEETGTEIDVTNDFTEIANWVREVTEPVVAEIAAV